MTEFSWEADATRLWLDMSRLAMVSTGWKTMSSAMPAEPVHSYEPLNLYKVKKDGAYQHLVNAQEQTLSLRPLPMRLRRLLPLWQLVCRVQSVEPL
jgi:hypothetical protein